jgi:(2Fe-2S) ferredoxin
MSRPSRHVFVCSQNRPPGHPRGACANKGSAAVLQALWAELQKHQAFEQVSVTYSGCFGPCDQGPNVLIYPEATLYSGVSPGDAPEIFKSLLSDGAPIERLLAPEAVW